MVDSMVSNVLLYAVHRAYRLYSPSYSCLPQCTASPPCEVFAPHNILRKKVKASNLVWCQTRHSNELTGWDCCRFHCSCGRLMCCQFHLKHFRCSASIELVFFIVMFKELAGNVIFILIDVVGIDIGFLFRWTVIDLGSVLRKLN